MTHLTLAAYRFFKRHCAAFYIILLGSFALWGLLASKMYYEEDISKLLPTSTANQGARYAFEKLKVKDKIFLEFRLNELGGEESEVSDEDVVDKLTEASDEFCNLLYNRYSNNGSNDIENILNKIESSTLSEAAEFVLNNAPCFLPADFYSKVDNILSTKALDSIMNANVELLSSDAGGIWYDIVCKDPLAFRNMAIAGLMGEQGSENSADSADTAGGLAIKNMHFFSADGSMALAFITPAFNSMDSKAGTRLVDNLLAQIEEFSASHPDIEVLFYGSPVQSVFNAKRIKKDLALTVSLALIVILLIIGWSFRTKSTLFYLLAPLVYGVVFAIAMVYIIQGRISFIALGIGCIVVGVALSYCIHVITHHKYLSDVEQVLKDQTKPVLLGSLTTIGSLLGLIFTRSSLLRDFGMMASFVMLGTTLFALFFLPQFFKERQSRKNEKAFNLIEKITTYPYWKLKWLVTLVVIAFIASVVFTRGKADFDTNLTNLGYFEPKVMLADSLYIKKINSNQQSEYIAVFSKDLNEALKLNKELDKLCKELKDSYIISSYTSPSAFLVDAQSQQLMIAKWDSLWTPAKRAELKKMVAESAERAGFEADMFEPFYSAIEAEYSPVNVVESGIIPQAMLSNFIERSQDSTYMVFTSILAPNKESIKLACNRISQGGASKNRELAEGVLIVNPFFYTTDMMEIMNHDFNIVLILSSLFVFIILLLSLRKFSYAIIAFLPMFMSWYLVLGLMKLLGIEFNLINIVISTFIFGMGVDYSIFVMDGLIKGSQAENEELLKYHRTAIFFSAVMLILAVGSLMAAAHPAISSIGLSTLAGMAATILITFTLQPLLFYKLKRDRNKKS